MAPVPLMTPADFDRLLVECVASLLEDRGIWALWDIPGVYHAVKHYFWQEVQKQWQLSHPPDASRRGRDG